MLQIAVLSHQIRHLSYHIGNPRGFKKAPFVVCVLDLCVVYDRNGRMVLDPPGLQLLQSCLAWCHEGSLCEKSKNVSVEHFMQSSRDAG